MEFDSKDFDNKTKKEDKPLSTSITGIKREHDSVDDFEHLDPEISPLKDLPPVEFQPKQVESLSDILKPIDHDIKDLHVDSFSKTLQPSTQTLSESIHLAGDLLSDFSTKSKLKDEISDLGNLEFPSSEHNHKSLETNLNDTSFLGDFKTDDFAAGTKHDVMKFLEAETSNNDKTERESDLNLTSDSFDVKDIFPDKPKPLNSTGDTGKLLGNIEEHYDTLIENIQGSLPSQVDKDFDSSIKPTKLESKEDIHFIPGKKSDFETEDIGYKFEPASSIGEFEHITHQQSKEGSPFDYIKDSHLISDPIEQLQPVKPSTPVKETKPVEEVKPAKQSEHINPIELDEFHDTEPVTNEPERKIEPIPEPKPVPVVVPVKSVDQDVKPKDEKPVKVKATSLDDIIGPEDVFKKIGLDAWFNPDRLHPKVEALIYWRDPKKSGVVFGGILAILLSLAYLSLISVVAYVSLFTLFGTIVFRVYKNILQAVQKTSEGHPFKEFLEFELSLPQDKVRELTDTAVTHINAAVVELRRLFLVEDLVDSIKFGVLLWCLTYIGALFNGLTIVILSFVALFTVPKVYENNKTSIDAYLDIGRSKIAEITSKVKAAVPIGKKEAEKEKDQ